MTPKMVRVLMNRLCRKGILDYTVDRDDARVYHYHALKSREKCLQSKSRKFADSYFSRNQSSALASLIQNIALTDEQIEELEEILRKSKGKVKKKGRAMCKLFMWRNNICITYWQVRYAYLLGMIISAGLIFRKHRKLRRLTAGMEKERIYGEEIYINEMSVTPFTIGLVHTKTIVPGVMLQNMRKEELRIILLHERTHIRLGHLWCCLLWDMIRILLWANPFLTICRGCFREDMESICDKVTMQKGSWGAEDYGMLLLRCSRLLHIENGEAAVTFAGEKDYAGMKRRFVRIADFRPYKEVWVSVMCIFGAAALTGVFVCKGAVLPMLYGHYRYGSHE